MNGYSGYTPDTYQRYADAFWYFPDDARSSDEGRRRDARHESTHTGSGSDRQE